MKKILMGLLVLLSVSAFSSEIKMKLTCSHDSPDNWPMLGSAIIELEVDESGSILKGSHGNLKGVGKTYSEETSLIIPLADFEYGSYIFDKEHYLYRFQKSDLINKDSFDFIEARAVSNVYMGHFDEIIFCQKI